MKCLLCESSDLTLVSHLRIKTKIFHCMKCDLIFKNSDLFLNFDDQKKRYDLHKNGLREEGYLNFLNQLKTPTEEILNSLRYEKSNTLILDWGSGPAPVLQEMWRNSGFHCDIYDPIYFPEAPQRLYHVITCSEVVEHFTDPISSFEKILSYLMPGGLLAIMTQTHEGPEHFKGWWYSLDPTHVIFFSNRTFEFLEVRFGLKIVLVKKSISIFKRQ